MNKLLMCIAPSATEPHLEQGLVWLTLQADWLPYAIPFLLLQVTIKIA